MFTVCLKGVFSNTALQKTIGTGVIKSDTLNNLKQL